MPEEFTPLPDAFGTYVDCLLNPEVTVHGKKGPCNLLFEAKGLHAVHALIDVSKCAALANADDRKLYYQPSTVYLRPDSDDAAGVGQVHN
jgi:hypothetical protein